VKPVTEKILTDFGALKKEAALVQN